MFTKKGFIKKVIVCLLLVSSLFLTGCFEELYEDDDTATSYRIGTKVKDSTDDEEQEEQEEEEVLVPGEITQCDFRTGIDTQGYSDAYSGSVVTDIPEDTRLHVLDVDNGYFKASYNDQEVWVPVKNCLINIKQYIPSLMVDLGLSHSPNYFNIGGESIAGLTGRDTDEPLYSNPGSLDGTEVWFRYEAAQNLLSAQEAFQNDGYCIKIYEAYRPHSATTVIRDALNKLLSTGYGERLQQQYFGSYGVGFFLAQNNSAHNYGLALDMSLADAETGEDIEMPSAIHTLDASSAIGTWKNAGTVGAENAQYLQDVMVSCGFGTLESEWWHFQLNTAEKIVFDVPN